MGQQRRLNRVRKSQRVQNRTSKAIYLEGIHRATQLMVAIHRAVPAPFTVLATDPAEGEVHAFSHDYFTVATNESDFEARRAFTEFIAQLTMSSGLIAVEAIDSGTAQLWMLGDNGVFPVPATPEMTAQMHLDFPMLSECAHVEALDLELVPA